jgi:uncharacterized protein YcfJ
MGRRSLPAGVQPYDRLVGARVGAITGGVVGIVPALLFSPGFAWVIVGAVLGAVAGYEWQRRDQDRRSGTG